MDVMAARRQILLNEPHIATATGAVATCVTDMRGLAKECVVQINPVQSGSGDPAPDNVRPISGWTGVTVNRTGANLLDYSTDIAGYRLNSIGRLAEYYNYRTSDWIPVTNGATYYFRAVVPSGLGYSVCRYTAKDESTFLGYKNIGTGTSMVSGYYTIPDDGTRFIRISYSRIYAGDPAVLVGTTDYTPYSGTTYPVTFPAMGKNLLDSVTITANKTIYTNGTIGNENGESITDYIPVAEGEKYALSAISGESGRARRIYGYDSNKDPVSSLASVGWVTTGTAYKLEATIPSGVSYIRSCYFTNDTDKSLKNKDNTVYGGTLDVVSGVMVAEWGMVDMGTLDWHKYGNTGYYYYCTMSDLKANSACICSCYPFSPYSTGANRLDKTVNTSYYYGPHVLNVLDSAYSTSADFKAAMSGIQLAYVLDTPITYTLTPQQITLLAGTNNVWADTGDTSVAYWKH